MTRIWHLVPLAALVVCALAGPHGGSVAADEICTTDAAGAQTCYPRIFAATSEFREVLPGQVVPPGLHIQFDMATGQRLARLATDESGPADTALAVVDDPALPLPPAVERSGRARGQVVLGGPNGGTRDLVGRIVDAGSKMADRTVHARVRTALDELLEAAYDPQQAERVMRSPGAVDALLRLGDPEQPPTAWPADVRRLASVALGTMVQNSPPLQGIAQRAGAVPALLAALQHEHDLVAAGRHLFALSALTRGHSQALAQLAALDGLTAIRDLWPLPPLLAASSSPKETAKFEARVVRFFEDALNPELTADLPAAAADFAPGWCRSLAARAAGSGTAEHRELFLRSLEALHAAYPAACQVPLPL
ncbi:nucleotide exchange factor sil1 [Coemansia spiralis]|nr:nucleotide exchange factor sil1 [Coemansia spiralis]